MKTDWFLVAANASLQFNNTKGTLLETMHGEDYVYYCKNNTSSDCFV
jgi:hypothetical protein